MTVPVTTSDDLKTVGRDLNVRTVPRVTKTEHRIFNRGSGCGACHR